MTDWDEHRKLIEAELARLKASLVDLEAGKVKHFEQLGIGPLREITRDLIAERRLAAASYEALLATIEKFAR